MLMLMVLLSMVDSAEGVEVTPKVTSIVNDISCIRHLFIDYRSGYNALVSRCVTMMRHKQFVIAFTHLSFLFSSIYFFITQHQRMYEVKITNAGQLKTWLKTLFNE